MAGGHAPDPVALADVVGRFERLELTLDQWKHRDHVRVAYAYLREHGFEEAVERMRRGLKAFLAHHRLPAGPDAGYHETVTVAWMALLHAVIRIHGPEADAEAFLARHAHFESKTLLLLYYSRERINSTEARARFLGPDLATFPHCGTGEAGSRST